MALMPIAEALERVLADAVPLPTIEAPLHEACGLVLGRDLAARRTQPPSSVSAMDGYAVRSSDLAATPATLTVIGEVAAGHPFSERIGAGQAARIFTGGVLPDGADAIVIQENTARDGHVVTIKKGVTAGANVRRKGLDFSEGDVLLARHRRLTDRDVMLAAAMNYASVPVIRRPKVAILATGDELVAPGSTPREGEIVYSNGFALAALARAQGADVLDLGVARDTIDDISAPIREARARQADILVTTGGASVGEHDLVQKALVAEGMSLSFWRIAMRPGRPMMHGTLGGMQVLGVPGNPVSSYVCSVLFLVPLIRKLAGRSDLAHPLQPAVLGRDMPENDERADYLRATLSTDADGRSVATALPVQDSSMMQALARADCLLIRERHAPAAAAGSPCVILKLAL